MLALTLSLRLRLGGVATPDSVRLRFRLRHMLRFRPEEGGSHTRTRQVSPLGLKDQLSASLPKPYALLLDL